MSRGEWLAHAQDYLDGAGVDNFVAAEIAPVGRLANGNGPALHAPDDDVLVTAVHLYRHVLRWVRATPEPAPVHVSSWYRDPAYNRAIGGAPRSIHLTGGAADVVKSGMDWLALAQMLDEEHSEAHLLGIGAYPPRRRRNGSWTTGFVHVDVRGLLGRDAPARWGPAGRWWR